MSRKVRRDRKVILDKFLRSAKRECGLCVTKKINFMVLQL